MTRQYQLFYGSKMVFEHTHYNACIGQAKFFYRRENMRYKQFYIWDCINQIKYYLNDEIIKSYNECYE